jgi:hypothetical protein
MKAWITRYALTTGILEVTCENPGDSNTIRFRRPGYTEQAAYGKDWHRTREAAVRHAEAMRVKKVASLQRSIEKLSKLEFK